MSELELAATVASEAAALSQTLSKDEVAETLDADALGVTQTAGGPRKVSDSLPVQNLAHFIVEQKLGSGGMGEVYQAHDISLDRTVAIKLLPEAVSESPQLRERFVREARAQARIRHPNVCHIYFIGEERGRLFFAMELAEGRTLAQRLEAEGPMTPESAIDIARQIVLGLRAAHELGFAHRDIKPSNLMLGSDGQVKLLDFGLVNAQPDGSSGGSVVETRGALGTPLYMSPEQARGEEVDFRSDMYSLGVTLHELVSGTPPFVADSAAELASAHSDSVRPRIRKRGAPKAAAVIDEVCDRLMAKSPDGRFSDYDELLAVLDRMSFHRSPPVRAYPRWFAFVADFVGVFTVAAVALIAVEAVLPWPLPGVVSSWLAPALLLAYYLWAYRGRGSTSGMNVFHLRIISSAASGPPTWKQIAKRLWWQWSLVWVSVVVQAAAAVLRVAGLVEAADFTFLVALLLAVVGFLRVVFYGLWASRNPRMRTVWDRRSATEIIFRPQLRREKRGG